MCFGAQSTEVCAFGRLFKRQIDVCCTSRMPDMTFPIISGSTRRFVTPLHSFIWSHMLLVAAIASWRFPEAHLSAACLTTAIGNRNTKCPALALSR